MIVKEHKNTVLAIVITALICISIHFAKRTSLSTIYQNKEPIEISIVHPFTHCLSVAMSEARQSGNPCTIKEAKSICHRLQEPANYKSSRKKVEEGKSEYKNDLSIDS